MSQELTKGYMDLRSRLPGETHDAKMSVGLYHPDGGCDFEFTVEFGTFSTGLHPSSYMKIQLFGDSIRAVVLWPTFFAGLDALRKAQKCEPTRDQFVWLLANFGFTDMSEPEPAPTVALSDVRIDEELWGVFLAECARQEITPSEYLPGILSEHLDFLNTTKR